MKIIIVSHPSRADHVEKLWAHLPVVTTVIDNTSALHGHREALRYASMWSERVVIMEDDAIPVVDFERLAQEWFDMRPDELLSFYLGTSRPRQYQSMVDERIRIADMQGRRDLSMPQLLHAVCYSLPPSAIAGVRIRMGGIAEADFAIGAAWGKSVCYPLESLVQHRDETPVERHPDGMKRTEPRVARRLAGPLMFNP